MTTELGNPFSTRYVRPGALEYQFPPGEDAEQLVERLQCNRWWGQIVGPHGAGKTSLLHALKASLLRADRQLCWCTLQSGERRLPADIWARREAWNSTTLVVVDGYEQLGWLARWRLKSCCRARQAGLLVTSHHDVGLPWIHHVNCSLPAALQLVGALLRQFADRNVSCAQIEGSSEEVTESLHAQQLVTDDDVATGYRRWKGNVRELFFGLYDLYESRRR